jgi:hypothetical protein
MSAAEHEPVPDVAPDAMERRWELDHGVTVTVAGPVPDASKPDGQPLPRVLVELPADRASLLGYLIETVCMNLAALAPLFGDNRGDLVLPAEQKLGDVLLEAANSHRRPAAATAWSGDESEEPES